MSIKLEVKSAGLTTGNTCSVKLGINTYSPQQPSSGLYLVIIDEASATVESSTFYDWSKPNDEGNFATKVKNIPNGHIVAIAAKGTPLPTSGVFGPAASAIASLSSKQAENLTQNGSWVLIYKMGSHILPQEQVSSTAAVSLSIDLYKITVLSYGKAHKDMLPKITVNSHDQWFGSDRGFYLTIFSPASVTNKVYNIYEKVSDAQDFNKAITDLKPGTIVAIAFRDTRDSADTTLTGRSEWNTEWTKIVNNLKSMGSVNIGQVKPSVGWAIVGRWKSTLATPSKEKFSPTDAVTAVNTFIL